MGKITSRGFDEHIRKSLIHSGHEFSTDKLNSVRDMFDHALVASKRTALKREHFDDTMQRMEEHHDWKKLSEGQREAVVSTLKKHLNIEDSTPK